MPTVAVIIAPILNEIALGRTLLMSLAGATMLAAMLVVSVATMRPSIAIAIVSTPPTLVSSRIGSGMRCPKITSVALVTAAPMNANSAIVHGSPIAWPRTWSFWLRAKREKSGIDSAIVPQNATALVSPAPRMLLTVGPSDRPTV